AALVQNQLAQALDAALGEARKAARPGDIDVRTGNFSLYPRFAAKGGITGWQGSTELVVEGRDIEGISRLAGRIPGMTIARVAFSLSREARAKVENEVTAKAIEQFRAKAEFVSRQFGFGGYSIREVALGTNDEAPEMMPRMRAMALASASDSALPVEAGKASVTARVNGSVQMSPGR
ncbi:MAG: SIMPL domain-containing protein, partial [Burkholderiales bacterium]|nr:SIMPL domain-containing protein [Burkholderiales bacterium]